MSAIESKEACSANPEPELAALRERVLAATGPDRLLDGMVHCVLELNDPAMVQDIAHTMQLVDQYWDMEGAVPRVTASIDSALALVERVLPGWRRSVYERSTGGWEAVLDRNFTGRIDKGPHEVICSSQNPHLPTAPLAILHVLLTALIAKEPQP